MPDAKRSPARARLAAPMMTAAAVAVALGCQGGSGGDAAAPGKGERVDETTDSRSGVPPGKNRLALEHSPYLLQHADNPVDWYAWGEEAFAAAEREDKPIFLSIGYSTCHWCHVMEHESFEDPSVAALMNDAFICIKVDREERPDIDNIYMATCQMLTGSGGWPLTILMTPSKEPFFAATYIPKAGMMQFVPRVVDAWKNNRDGILADARRLTAALRDDAATARGAAVGRSEADSAFAHLSSRFDSTNGGFGGAPKFPTPHNLLFLLRYWKRTGDGHALSMVERTLERMRAGGVYDHVGFGFHRYSTDARWFLPHFEKMLYDQALMAMACTEAYQATGDDAYRRTAREIFTYVLRDLADPEGGFHSAEDADSEGEEGKFYLWTAGELRSLLGDDAGVAVAVFGVEEEGNFVEETAQAPGGEKTNILSLPLPLPGQAAALGLSEVALEERVESIRRRLFEAREKRVRPGRDDKVLTDWNGLMIAALAKAARAFDEPEYARRAVAAADFVTRRMSAPGGALLHRYRAGYESIAGMVDDYAFLVWGLLELYETTFEVGYLEEAIVRNGVMMEKFWDDAGGGLFFTPSDGEALIARQKEVYDGAVPSGNSVAMLNLIRLARVTGETRYEERAVEIGRAFQSQVARGPSAFTMLLCAAEFVVGPSNEVVIAGRAGAQDVRAMTTALERTYAPNKVVVFRPEGSGGRIVELAPYTKEHRPVEGRATVYVCRNFACELPTTSAAQMLESLENTP
jgi:hypothetical protein